MEYDNNLEATNRKFLEAIGNLNEAFQDERSDLVYYEYLIHIAPTAQEKEILYPILNDERVHATLFRRMYEELSGIDASYDPKEKLVMPESYLAGINDTISRELRELERYKAIRERFPAGTPYIYTLSNIIADEVNHISQLNYILSLNSKINSSSMNENQVKQYTANFTLDDWARFIRPLVSRALAENGDAYPEQFYRKLILSGILIGLGRRPLEAIELVERWKQNGASQFIKSSEEMRNVHKF